MNRFEYLEARLKEDENFVCRDKGVKIYDGEEKTQFEDGDVILTTHRLIWGHPDEISRGLVTPCLSLKYIVSIEEETVSSFIFGKKIRIILKLWPPESGKAPGPMDQSTANFVILSKKNGLYSNFIQALRETVQARIWEVTTQSTVDQSNVASSARKIKLRSGIVGIERSIKEKQKATDESISVAFQDLKALMALAEDMVTISRVISTKIREKGEISEDETVRFKSYLMSLGIDDPVTRDSFTSNNEYFKRLSNQIIEILLDPIEESDGMMSLADAYCRVNRARGLELISPEDLLNACKFLDGPIKLRQFSSGASILQLESHDDKIVADQVAYEVENEKSLSAEKLAKILGISVLLAKERLLTSEKYGKICRDESVEGLRFYTNLFLKEDE